MVKLTKEKKELLKQSVDELFHTYDSNKNGLIEASELKNYVFTEFSDVIFVANPEEKKKRLEEEYLVILKKADKNKDGSVTKAELMKALEVYFV